MPSPEDGDADDAGMAIVVSFVGLGNHSTANNSYSMATAVGDDIHTKPGPGLKSWPEYHVAMALVLWGIPFVVLFGTVGNIIAFCVLVTKRMRTTSVNVYLALLALADTSVLYFSGLKTWLRALTGFELLHVSDPGCRITMFLVLLGLHMSAWIVVCVSVDRFMAVWFPFKALSICNAGRARIISLVLFIILVIYNSHVFWTMQLRQSPNGRWRCAAAEGYTFMTTIYPWLKLATYSCIPFVIVLVLNACIVVKVIPGFRSNTDHNGPLSSDSRSSQQHHIKDKRLTIMLVSISISWLVLTSPIMLWTFLPANSGDTHVMARHYLCKSAAFLLMYINHALNFYLYCLSGQRFRKALTDTLCCCTIYRQPRANGSTIEISLKTYRTTTHANEQYL